jgi:hypothetical protein
MELRVLLAQKKSSILTRWFDLTLAAYPLETVRHLKKDKNRFSNPVGSTIREGLQGIYEVLLTGFDRTRIAPPLDKVVRIMAVQGLLPSQALTFIPSLKKLVREELVSEIDEQLITSAELEDFDGAIDALMMLACDIFMECREKIYELRVDEVKNRTFRLLQRANLIWTAEEQEPVLEEGLNNNNL